MTVVLGKLLDYYFDEISDCLLFLLLLLCHKYSFTDIAGWVTERTSGLFLRPQRRFWFLLGLTGALQIGFVCVFYSNHSNSSLVGHTTQSDSGKEVNKT